MRSISPRIPLVGRPCRRPAALAGALLIAACSMPAWVAAPSPAAGASRATYATTIADGRAAATAMLEASGASSVSIALVDQGSVVWRETFGHLDGPTGAKPTVDTLYGLGSVSKMVTTSAVMKLVDAGTVSLDAPVVRYVPDFRMASPEFRQITVRMLLDHSAGLPGADYRNFAGTVPYPGFEQQILADLATERIKTTPGAMSVYCNECFNLAQIVVARASGKPFPAFVADEILRPLGMTRSRYGDTPFVEGSVARAFDAASGALTPQEYPDGYGSGGFFSTPTEMAKLATMLANGGVHDGRRILSAASVAEMSRDQTRSTLDVSGPLSLRFGLGWDTVAERALVAAGVPGWWKSGDIFTYSAGLLVAPKAGLAVIIENAGPFGQHISAQTLAERVMLHALVDHGTLRSVPRALGRVTLPKRTPTAAQLRAVEGIYVRQGGVAYRLTAQRDRSLQLAMAVGDAWTPILGPFTLRSDGLFWNDASPGTAIRAGTGWGRTYLVGRLTQGYGTAWTDAPMGQRIAPGEPLSAAWSARLGKTWLMTNVDPTDFKWLVSPATHLATIPDLPGYLDIVDPYSPAPVDVGGSDTFGSMFLVAPVEAGRDLVDLDVVVRDGEEWLGYGSFEYRPAATVPALPSGPSSVAIDAEGRAEWRTVTGASPLAIEGAAAWKVFDAVLAPVASGLGDASAVPVPAGGYIVLFGPAGTTVRVVR